MPHTNTNPALATPGSAEVLCKQNDPANSTATASGTRPSPAQTLSFHPLADLFPLMEGEEFEALVADIEKNGLQQDIVLYQGKILDGRNRYRVLLALGWDSERIKEHCFDPRKVPGACGLKDPAAYVISANLRRRHLSAEQKRGLIAKLIKAHPEKSDRQIGNMIKADNKTVAAVRSDLERREEIPHVEARTDTKGRKQPAKKVQRQGAKPAEAGGAIASAIDQMAAHTRATDEFLDDEGNYAPVDLLAGQAARVRGFLYRAQQSVFAAQAESFKDIECKREMVEAAKEVAAADNWRNHMAASKPRASTTSTSLSNCRRPRSRSPGSKARSRS